MNNNLDFLLINCSGRYKINVLEDGELRAYLYISLGGGEINIDIFNVLHKYQRKGYGKRIIEELRKYYTITGESTESARFFWEAVGAEFTSLSDFIIHSEGAGYENNEEQTITGLWKTTSVVVLALFMRILLPNGIYDGKFYVGKG